MLRVPTDDEYATYDGAHCFHLWRGLPETWRCPGCDRAKREILRWTLRTPMGQRFWGWMAGLHRHHDHGVDYLQGLSSGHGRFPITTICDQCNSADGAAKRRLGLPDDFSFSPGEIRQFVTAVPHGKHRIDMNKAHALFLSLGIGQGARTV